MNDGGIATGGRNRAFEELLVLELGTSPPAGWPGMMLSDLGARVIKIESPDRVAPPTDEERKTAAHSYINRNKQSIALDLKQPRGQELFLDLARRADVIVEGFRPGVMARLNLSYEHIAPLNRRIVYCSMSGFGQTGPYRSHPAHDLNFLAMAGVLSQIGVTGSPPDIPLNSVADYGAAAMHAAFGIVGALFERERSGQGQHVDVSYLDTTLALLAAAPGARTFLATGRVPSRGEGIFSGEYPYYSIYDTQGGGQLTIACTEARLWKNFCALLGRPEFDALAYRAEHAQRRANAQEQAARNEIQKILATRTRDGWGDLLANADVCFGKVLGIDEVVEDPQVLARGMVAVTHEAGAGEVRHFGSAIKYSGMTAQPRAAGPLPGQHTSAVLARFGLSPEQIHALSKDRVIA